MTPGLTSIIVPTFNHADYLRDAIDSALAQTAPVEIIVIDDASTDSTPDILAGYGERVFSFRLGAHSGPSHARNAGLSACNGEFVMFLDSDDLIHPQKVSKQVERMNETIGWVLCDVLIQDVSGKTQTASQRYEYGNRVGGWIQDLLTFKNVIPIMSPLIRRSVVGDIRFRSDRRPEDWHFWHEVSAAARCAYLPEVLATYRKRRGGRSSTLNRPRFKYHDTIVQPLRLNLGCGTPDTRSWHPIEGMQNLDRSMGWSFEDGLGDYVDGSVAGITISHSLMYVRENDWPAVFSEFARVLAPGATIRITEDDATNPASSRLGGWKGSQPAVTKTDAAMVRRYLSGAGFIVHDVTSDTTNYRDRSLMQAQHGAPPDVFFIEGVRECAVLFSPHSDDETLFAAYSIIRHKPRVFICFPSRGDYGDTMSRLEESRRAVAILGGGPVEQWGDNADLLDAMRGIEKRLRPTKVFAPSDNASHPEHVAVARAAREVFGERVVYFHTYNADTVEDWKVRSGTPVAFEPHWVALKSRALAEYVSQLTHPRAREFFHFDLAEYREP